MYFLTQLGGINALMLWRVPISSFIFIFSYFFFIVRFLFLDNSFFMLGQMKRNTCKAIDCVGNSCILRD